MRGREEETKGERKTGKTWRRQGGNEREGKKMRGIKIKIVMKIRRECAQGWRKRRRQ